MITITINHVYHQVSIIGAETHSKEDVSVRTFNPENSEDSMYNYVAGIVWTLEKKQVKNIGL